MAKAQPKYRLTIDWMPTYEDLVFVEVHRPEITQERLSLEIKKFRAYWMERLDKNAEKRAQDWKMAWRNWIGNVIVKPSYAPKQQYQTKAERARNFTDALEGRRSEQPYRIIDIN